MLQNISLERLMQALVSLDQQVEIIVKPARRTDIAAITAAARWASNLCDEPRLQSERDLSWIRNPALNKPLIPVGAVGCYSATEG